MAGTKQVKHNMIVQAARSPTVGANWRHARDRPRASEDRCRLPVDHSRQHSFACHDTRGTLAEILPRLRRRQKGALRSVDERRTTCRSSLPWPTAAQGRDARRRFLHPTPAHRSMKSIARLKWKTIPIPHVTFHRWLAFHEPLSEELRLIPDGYVEFADSVGNRALPSLKSISDMREVAIWKEKVSANMSSSPTPESTNDSSIGRDAGCSSSQTLNVGCIRSGRQSPLSQKALLVCNA